MGWICYCPLVGGRCNKGEPEIKVQMETFFLAEPFKPQIERSRRERAVKNALKEALKDFSEISLRVADKEPKDPTIFCDVCRLIQSSAYGIVDVSRLNPNVLLELGMMFSLGKPVFVLVKRSEEENLREKLPSDIVWKRVIPYEEFIDIEEELSKQIQSRPRVEPKRSLAEECAKLFAEVDPDLSQAVDAKIQEMKAEQKEKLKNLEELLKKARLDETIPRKKEIEIPSSLEKQISKLYRKVEEIEKFVGFPENPEIAFFRGNWHYHRKQFDRASELYDWALILKPDFREVWVNKGVTLFELGKYEEAIACFDKAIEIKKDDETAWNNKGAALGKLGKREEAIACFDKAIEIKKDNGEAWFNKGVALFELGKHEEAIACLEETLRINPNDLDALENLSEALLILGDLAKGLEMAKKASGLAEEAEDKAICRFLSLSAYLFKGESKRAQKEIEKLKNYLRSLEKGFKMTEWDFSPLLPAIQERLGAENKRKILSIISLLKGKIGLEELEKRTSSKIRQKKKNKELGLS